MSFKALTVLQLTGSYTSLFAIASVSYLAAVACIQLFVPRIESTEDRGFPVIIPETPV